MSTDNTKITDLPEEEIKLPFLLRLVSKILSIKKKYKDEGIEPEEGRNGNMSRRDAHRVHGFRKKLGHTDDKF